MERGPRLTDDERRLLALKGKALGLKVLEAVACMVTPEMVRAWHRRIIALKWAFHHKAAGRPKTGDDFRSLIFELAQSNPRLGYASIRDRLSNLGHRVNRATVARVLRQRGLEPAPIRSRKAGWMTFLKAHLDEQGIPDAETAAITCSEH